MMMSKEDADFLQNHWFSTEENYEFDYLSLQYTLAHYWLKAVRKCKCKLSLENEECRHITSALNKLYGKKVDDMWNKDLREHFGEFAKATGFKIPYKLQKSLKS